MLFTNLQWKCGLLLLRPVICHNIVWVFLFYAWIALQWNVNSKLRRCSSAGATIFVGVDIDVIVHLEDDDPVPPINIFRMGRPINVPVWNISFLLLQFILMVILCFTLLFKGPCAKINSLYLKKKNFPASPGGTKNLVSGSNLCDLCTHK